MSPAQHWSLEGTAAAPSGPPLACVILAHTDPVHVRRLIEALDPFPVYLHCDVSTPPPVFEAMTRDLPARCHVMERMATGWARWENVAAELAGYRAALAGTNATHVAVLTGSDYPIVSSAAISSFLADRPGISFAGYQLLPYEEWGRSGGLSRLRYRHWAIGKRMLRLPVPRRLPPDLTLAGGSQLKVLAREHAAAVLRAADDHPELIRFFTHSWIADETFIASVLSTPHLAPGWSSAHIPKSMWWIGWDGSRRKSPPWLGMEHLEDLRSSDTAANSGVPRVFARKFATDHDTDVLDAIDAELRRDRSPT